MWLTSKQTFTRHMSYQKAKCRNSANKKGMKANAKYTIPYFGNGCDIVCHRKFSTISCQLSVAAGLSSIFCTCHHQREDESSY